MSNGQGLRAWLAESRDHPPGRATGSQVIEQWRGREGTLTADEARELSLRFDEDGFCFEPDIRFSGHILRPADTVIFYPGTPEGAPSDAYLAAAAVARLGVIAASADGAVVAEEQNVLRERTSKAIHLNASEGRRLEAYVEWLLDTPVALDAVDNEAAGLPETDRERIGHFLVAVAGADGYISRPERWMLAGSFAHFGLDPARLDAEITSFMDGHVAAALGAEVTPIPLALDAVHEVLEHSADAIANLAGTAPVAAPPAPARRQRADHSYLLAEWFGGGPMPEIAEWEAAFASQWGGLSAAERGRSGSLLALVPPREQWEAFIAAWKKWPLVSWLAHASEVPHSLAVLFGGFAFFEYDETSFWPQFARDLWPISDAERGHLRTAHAAALETLGLDLARNQSADRMTVASAVHHIGVPLSLWPDFLGIADHVLRQPDWRAWDSERWAADMTARCGPRVRLRAFLTANEVAAREIIGELGDIRAYAEDEPDTTLDDLASVTNVPFLRAEHFADDMPEMAEFLRPDNLLSLFAGKCFLRFDEETSRLQVHLPAVTEPGCIWQVGDHEQAARREPSWFAIDADGFARWIDVHLDGPSGRRTRKVPGIHEWGLYDHHRQAFLSLDLRHQTDLRMGEYTLLSPSPLHMTHKGFLDEYGENQVVILADRTRCYATRLSPAPAKGSVEGSLTVRWSADGDLRSHTIIFRTRLTTRTRTILINGVERPMPDPSLPWYFLRPGPYPPVAYAALPSMELIQMHDSGNASTFARLKGYAQEGVLAPRRDGALALDHERVRVCHRHDPVHGDVIEVRLLGRPSNMWNLGREREPLEVDLVGEGGLTYVRAIWTADYEHALRDRFRRYDLDVVSE